MIKNKFTKLISNLKYVTKIKIEELLIYVPKLRICQ